MRNWNLKLNKRKSMDEPVTNAVARFPVKRHRPDYRTGLSSEQARVNMEAGWFNQTVETSVRTTKDIIYHNVFTYFNGIFVVLAALLIVAGSFRNLTFMPVIIANTFIGIIQEIRAKKTLEKLNVLNAPRTIVVRDGKKKRIPSDELVVDDIVIFKGGNQICADAVVVSGEVSVNESLLTGESDDVIKTKGAELFSGSFVVAGECYARLENVGVDSYVSKLTIEAKAMNKKEQSEMIRSLDQLVKYVGIALIPIGLILFTQSFFFNHEGFRQSIEAMVAAVIGMIPEGLYLLTSVALAVSAMRLASRKVLLHDMKSIETLARVNVLCVDKTGTITEPSMSVQKMIPVRRKQNGNEELSYSREELIGLISDFVQTMKNDNITMAAMKDFFVTATGRVSLKTFGFSSAYKYSGACFEEGSFVLGAPEFILRKDYERYENRITNYTKKGYRVLVFAKYQGELDGKQLVEKAIPIALILLMNPIRKEAPETFQYFTDQGVEIKVISGDHPMTVSEIAMQANIPNADQYVDATTLDSEEKLRNAAVKYTVFGRVTPKQKRQLVHALQDTGNTVAMTGDGVNDVLALKDADCSVALASGSDAAIQAAQVVLLESNFACMPDVVLEGRRVVNNIQRSASLFLVKNIFSILLSLFSVFLMITYPLEPSQVSLISMFTIGVPGFFLAFQPNKERIEGVFMKNVLFKAFPGALVDVLSVAALVVFGQTFGVEAEDIATASTMLLAIVGFMILYKICMPMNVYRLGILGGCMILLIGCSLFLPNLFAITGMSTKCIMLFVVFAIATEPLFRLFTGLSVELEKVGSWTVDHNPIKHQWEKLKSGGDK